MSRLQVEMPDYCHIIHTETIQRHGARHLNNVNKLDKAIHYFEDLCRRFCTDVMCRGERYS